MELASKHGAITDWRKTLEGTTFSIDVERALIDSPGEKPILVVESAQDVFKRTGEFWIRISDWLSLPPSIDFELRCPKEKLSPLLENRERFQIDQKVAVVAKVNRVRKIVLELNAVPISDEEAELDLEPPFPLNDRFLASGECIDLVYMKGKAEKGVR